MAPPDPQDNGLYTLDNGCPIRLAQGSLRVGEKLQGVHLIRDINLIETISHITHERIPERVVHAKGAGAYGEFEVTNEQINITDYTDADFLKVQGGKTPLFARFSTVVGERGSADSVRDTRGFAFKLYTKTGNLDWVFFSTPTFPIRDGGKFPSFVHSQKRNPQTGVRDPSMFWDFMSRNPETFHTLMYIFSDRGTPKSYRESDVYGVNTYKFTKEVPSSLPQEPPTEEFFYVKIQFLSQDRSTQGNPDLTQAEAEKLAGEDPDAYTRDLFNKIKDGKFPSWVVQAQIIKPEDVATYPVNIFDPTKTWPEAKTPWKTFGKITLTKNPEDYFEEVEQVSFNPGAVVPGWDVSPDPILQTRLFAYGSAARYRLGINFHQLPVNATDFAYNPAKRDGAGYVNKLNPRIQPNYFPADGQPPRPSSLSVLAADQDIWSGGVIAYQSTVTDDDWVQPRELWEEYKKTSQDSAFVSNVALSLKNARENVRERTYSCFGKIAKDLEDRIRDATGDKTSSQTAQSIVGGAASLEIPVRAAPNRGGVGG